MSRDESQPTQIAGHSQAATLEFAAGAQLANNWAGQTDLPIVWPVHLLSLSSVTAFVKLGGNLENPDNPTFSDL